MSEPGRGRWKFAPLSLQLDVITPSRRPALFDEWEEPPVLGTRAELFFPSMALSVGGSTSIVVPHGSLAPQPLGRNGRAWAFEFAEVGDYRVVIRYGAPYGSESRGLAF